MSLGHTARDKTRVTSMTEYIRELSGYFLVVVGVEY